MTIEIINILQGIMGEILQELGIREMSYHQRDLPMCTDIRLSYGYDYILVEHIFDPSLSKQRKLIHQAIVEKITYLNSPEFLGTAPKNQIHFISYGIDFNAVDGLRIRITIYFN